MKQLQNKLKLAKKALNKSVSAINPNIYDEHNKKDDNPAFVGVKNTNQIPDEIIERIWKDTKMAWLTVDKASSKGRAIDTDLHNPLTYRLMTGSTSGGPINILKGINDVAIGTDGGGSVLAPAMSCQLPSVIGAGVGLYVNRKKRSTEGQEFTGSIGVIAKEITTVKEITESLLANSLTRRSEKPLKVMIPEKGSVICPDGRDMQEKVMTYFSRIENGSYATEKMHMSGIAERTQGMSVVKDAFENKQADIILTHEGPIDVYGYGETIPMTFGAIGQDITKNHGKYLIRAANMCQTTAITVPTKDLASGLVIIANRGIENAKAAFRLATELENVIHLPEVWKRYFLMDQLDDRLNLKERWE